jgi:Mn-dependent DtxR family transcriptional regulator
MMEPDRLVISLLARPGRHDVRTIRMRTRLSRPVLHQTLRKLTRMGRIAADAEGYRLTTSGRRTARALRGAS